jgi:hypothetical protein
MDKKTLELKQLAISRQKTSEVPPAKDKMNKYQIKELMPFKRDMQISMFKDEKNKTKSLGNSIDLKSTATLNLLTEESSIEQIDGYKQERATLPSALFEKSIKIIKGKAISSPKPKKAIKKLLPLPPKKQESMKAISINIESPPPEIRINLPEIEIPKPPQISVIYNDTSNSSLNTSKTSIMNLSS